MYFSNARQYWNLVVRRIRDLLILWSGASWLDMQEEACGKPTLMHSHTDGHIHLQHLLACHSIFTDPKGPPCSKMAL